MNINDRFEHELADWFVETAAPRTPDYADDILRQTAGTSQRPRWTFADRWIPESVVTAVRTIVRPIPWRAIGVLVILALLAAAAIYVGSRPRLPTPFGPAANGLVAYEMGGDIYAVDPATGLRRPIVIGSEQDHDPRFSLDGTRLCFLRSTAGRDVLVVADADGSDVIVANLALDDADSDSIAWSPDGRSIAIGAVLGGKRGLYIVDSTDGEVTPLAVDYTELEVYWRPPDGRQLMFVGGSGTTGLFLVSLDGEGVKKLPGSDGDQSLRPSGWTPDGRRFAFHRRVADLEALQTFVVDVATGDTTMVPVEFGQLSNDGTRIAGYNSNFARTWVCVARIDEGSCVDVGRDSPMLDVEARAALQWSPDDRWLLARPASGDPVLIDPEGGPWLQPQWSADGAESWQRVAP